MRDPFCAFRQNHHPDFSPIGVPVSKAHRRSAMQNMMRECPIRSALKAARLAALGALLFFAGLELAQGASNFVCVSTAAELQQALTNASNGGAHVNDDNII